MFATPGLQRHTPLLGLFLPSPPFPNPTFTNVVGDGSESTYHLSAVVSLICLILVILPQTYTRRVITRHRDDKDKHAFFSLSFGELAVFLHSQFFLLSQVL